MTRYRFECVLEMDDDWDELTEDDLDLGPLYYGDKHMQWGLTTVPGSIRKVEE